MVTITVAKHAGFCFGVKKAIEIAEEVADSRSEKTYVYGQLVHNERVIDDLEKKGIVFADNLEQIPDNATTVLRAHGEPGTTYENLDKKQITDSKLFDATCPLVTLVHNVAKKLKNNGYEVIIFGKHDHPESIGTKYHIRGDQTCIVESEDEFNVALDYIKEHNVQKAAVISQTTMSVAGYAKLIENLNENSDLTFEKEELNLAGLNKPFIFVDTICNPTKLRQTDTHELAKNSDVVIIIGGLNSSNSKELHQTCKDLGVQSYYVQAADQLQSEWFGGKERIGISAGASTPDITIKEVEEKINEMTA